MEEEKTVYTTCRCNCGGNYQCVIKAHVKKGKVIAVEPDDRYNPNVGREDEAVSETDLLKIKLQRRPCTMGLAFHQYLYHPDRIIYPLKRAQGTGRGEGKWQRISWDEALDTIAGKMQECREKYGPYSIMTSYMPNETAERLFSFWGAGVDGWGWCSYDATRLMAQVMTGVRGWDYAGFSSGSGADMLANARMVVLWGNDPTVAHQGPGHQWAYFIKLARERGKPVIIIDPRYSVAAQKLADQWIPIKPGTDAAMMLGMAYVLFKENLWDKAFVDKFVEPVGFQKWQEYVLGVSDRTAKTPEWAEVICAVPAETIRALALMIGTVKPAWLWAHFSISRQSHGEQTIWIFSALQAMMGNWGSPGAGPSLHIVPQRDLPVNVSSGAFGPPGPYKVPKFFRSHFWAEAVLMLDKVRSGEMSQEEYLKMMGWKADPDILSQFNPKFLFWGGGSKPHTSNHVSTACNSSNNQVKAFQKFDFIIAMHSIMNPTIQYADIILPAQDWMWEETGITHSAAYGAFESVNYCPGVVEPPGECRPWAWVYCKIAERLGIDPKKFFPYYTTDENWEKDWERYHYDGYQNLIKHYQKQNIQIPSWKEFSAGKFINCDEYDDVPHTGWDEQIKKGKPFKTKSGKIEFYSEYVAREANRGKGEHIDPVGQPYDNLPSDWADMTPSPTYMTTRRGMDDPLVQRYPIMLLTPHSRYRVHYVFWEHQILRDLYRHAVWINVADARARGVKDGDLIQVFNDRGKVVMPAYVTSRIMPGLAVIHAGAKVIHDETGTDRGASPSTLLGGDFESCLAPARATTLVQIALFQDSQSISPPSSGPTL